MSMYCLRPPRSCNIHTAIVLKLLQSENWDGSWIVETCHYFETWQRTQFSPPESLIASINRRRKSRVCTHSSTKGKLKKVDQNFCLSILRRCRCGSRYRASKSRNARASYLHTLRWSIYSSLPFLRVFKYRGNKLANFFFSQNTFGARPPGYMA